jgi:hypothetical protein
MEIPAAPGKASGGNQRRPPVHRKGRRRRDDRDPRGFRFRWIVPGIDVGKPGCRHAIPQCRGECRFWIFQPNAGRPISAASNRTCPPQPPGVVACVSPHGAAWGRHAAHAPSASSGDRSRQRVGGCRLGRPPRVGGVGTPNGRTPGPRGPAGPPPITAQVRGAEPFMFAPLPQGGARVASCPDIATRGAPLSHRSIRLILAAKHCGERSAR